MDVSKWHHKALANIMHKFTLGLNALYLKLSRREIMVPQLLYGTIFFCIRIKYCQSSITGIVHTGID